MRNSPKKSGVKQFNKPTVKKSFLDKAQEEKPFSKFRKDSPPPRREGDFDKDRKPFGERKPYGDRPPRREGDFDKDRKPFGERKPYGDRPPRREGDFDKDRKPFGERKTYGDRPPRREGDFDKDRKPFGERKPYGDRPPRREGDFDKDRKPFGERKTYGDRPPRREGDFDKDRKPFGERKPYGDRPARTEGDFDKDRKPFGERKPYGDRPARREGDFDKDRKPFGERKPYGDRPPRTEGDFDKDRKPFGERKPYGDRPARREGDFDKDRKPFDKRERSGSQNSDKPYKKPPYIGGKPSENTNELRLNRYISNAGVCSRRDADELIATGQITVNGKVITEMGYKVMISDVVKYGKKTLNPEQFVYVLLNKPKDYITTTEDPEERKTVMDLVADACTQRIYPVGRLDRMTTGLLLLTNDGELAEKLMHPSNNIKKVYQVELNKPINNDDFEAIQKGLELEDGHIKPDALGLITPDAEVIGIELHSGRNRIVRRIFEHLGYDVLRLDRTVYAGLNKKELPRGKWRFLDEKEVIRLKYMM